MIDRKAIWISLLLVLAMIAASLWRLSLLPDWHHVPLDGPSDSRTISVVRMFADPLAVLFVMGMLFARKWSMSGPEEAVQPWRHYNGLMLAFSAGMTALAQAFLIARSMGTLQSVDRLTVRHVVFVATGIFVMVVGNVLPKMPWLTTRFRPLDPWQWNRHLRFVGKLTVVIGFVIAVEMPRLPIKMVLPVLIGVALTTVAVGFWHRAKVKREPSPHT